jgi:hypothetical protein
MYFYGLIIKIMEQPVQNNYLKTLRILCVAMLAGLCFLLLISILLVSMGIMPGGSIVPTQICLIVLAVLLLGSIGGGYYYLYNKRLQSIPDETDVNTRLNLYRAAFLLRCACIEGPGFLSVMFFMLTGNYIFAGIAGLLILLLISNYPKRDKIATILELTEDEKVNFL